MLDKLNPVSNMENDSGWIKTHFNELREKYPGQYVAVYKDKVVATGFTAGEVLKRVKKEDRKHVTFMHIPKTKTVFYFFIGTYKR